MRAAIVAEPLGDPFPLAGRRIQFAFVDRHDLNSSMNCDKQQKTVGLWAPRAKALEAGSKLLGFQYCEARGQAPPLKVVGMPVRKRCLIASVQYRTQQPKSIDHEKLRSRPQIFGTGALRWQKVTGAPCSRPLTLYGTVRCAMSVAEVHIHATSDGW